jgi:hypothetical protein
MNLSYLQKLNRHVFMFSHFKAFIGVLSLFLVLFCQSSFGQTGSLVDIPTFGGQMPNNLKVTTIGSAKTVTGSFYLDSEWTEADVYLVMDSMIIKGLKTRIDLRNNLLEVKCDDGIKVLSSFRIRSIFYPKSKTIFVTENALKIDQRGFYKIVVNNDKSLLCRYDTEILRSNYNVQMAIGDKNDQIVKNKNYFLFSNTKLIKLKHSRKTIKKQFKSKPIVLDYLSKHKTNPKIENSLIQFTDYLNIQNIEL